MKHFLKYSVIALLLIATFASKAETVTWKNLTPPGWFGDFKFVEWFAGNGLMAIADNGYFYKSLDTGATWTPYPRPIDTVVTAMLVCPDHKRAFLYNNTQIFKTTDAANSWQEIHYTGLPSGVEIGKIFIKDGDTLFLVGNYEGKNGTSLGVFISTNMGQTWNITVINNAYLHPGYLATGSYFMNSKQGYIFGYDYYFNTLDGGLSWTQTELNDSIGNTVNALQIPGHLASLIINGVVLNISGAYVTSMQKWGGITQMIQADSIIYGLGTDVNNNKVFYQSSNFGQSYTYKALAGGNISGFYMTFLDSLNGVIVDRALTCYRTKDGGKTWTTSIYGGSVGLHSIYCKSSNECFVPGGNGRLFHTTDGGETWNYHVLLGASQYLENIEFPTIDTGYLTANSNIYRTIDGGSTWTSFPDDGNTGEYIHFLSKDTGYVGLNGSSEMDITTDAGKTWNVIMGDANYIYDAAGFIWFKNSKEGLAPGYNSTTNVGELLYTNDGGNSFLIKDVGIDAYSTMNIKDNWLVSGDNKVYLCDKDLNCSLKYTSNSTALHDNPIIRDTATYLYVISRDSILMSRDAGNTWNMEYFPFPNYSISVRYISIVQFVNPNLVYCVGIDGIYKGIVQTLTVVKQFKRIDNNNFSCTLTNATGNSFNAAVELINSQNDTVVLNSSVVINNNAPFTITIPNTIQAGTGYKIRIVPTDTASYSTVVSTPFDIVTGIEEIKSKPVIRVVDNTIVSDCQNNVEVYNTLGQRVYPSNLPAGVYIVKCNSIVQKVVIK